MTLRKESARDKLDERLKPVLSGMSQSQRWAMLVRAAHIHKRWLIEQAAKHRERVRRDRERKRKGKA